MILKLFDVAHSTRVAPLSFRWPRPKHPVALSDVFVCPPTFALKSPMMDAMKKLLFADDQALVANGKHELQETMEEWNGLFTRHGLKLNLEKTEVLLICRQREEMDIELGGGDKLTQRDSFVSLGGAVCRDGKTERGTSKSTSRSEHVESSDGGPADLKMTE